MSTTVYSVGGEAEDAQEAVDGLAGGGEREARRAVAQCAKVTSTSIPSIT
jgi:hypothetical protein